MNHWLVAAQAALQDIADHSDDPASRNIAAAALPNHALGMSPDGGVYDPLADKREVIVVKTDGSGNDEVFGFASPLDAPAEREPVGYEWNERTRRVEPVFAEPSPDAGLDKRRLRQALTLDWAPFWRDTPIEEPDGVHGMSTEFDLAAFTDAVVAEYERLAPAAPPPETG